LILFVGSILLKIKEDEKRKKELYNQLSELEKEIKNK